METTSLIVGIGASAGGIKALKSFFEHTPAQTGIAYVVILHLSPDHESHLAEVLQSSTAMPVMQVRERIHVEPDHVYVISPQQSLAMADGEILVSEMTRIEERRAPVDVFFRTLADSHRSHAICVVLSGTGANGSMGMKRVKERGGICLVQDPEEAEYGDMPRNSIATTLVDDVLPVAAIPARILAYKDAIEKLHLPEEPAEPPPSDEDAMNDIFLMLRTRTGHDFSNYKRGTILRRLGRRMGINGLWNLAGYVRFLRDHPDESAALLKDLLISVTNFFRDKDAFAALEQRVIPRLFEGKDDGDHIRVWIAGCATGEEAYSIAMLLSEHQSKMSAGPAIQVFATDIDEHAVAFARDGIYTLNDAADLSPERLQRFFQKDGDRYRVRKELREMVLFAHHNVLKDPPFLHLDLVSCRNLLIYLNPSAQRRVLEIVHFALNPNGFVLLGSAESIDTPHDLFSNFDEPAHIFRQRTPSSRPRLPALDLPRLPRGETRALEPRSADLQPRDRPSGADLHQRLLEEYAPPSVVINDDHEIVHLSAKAGRYLVYQGGEPSHDLLKAVRPDLRLDLRAALYQAEKDGTHVEARGVHATIGDRLVTLNILVRPVREADDATRGLFLVVFDEEPEGATPAPATPLKADDAQRHLEDELLRTKERLRATVGRHETQAEELKATNEELLAMNEELRSAAEELETSKEELQSLNEELRTVNQELKTKVEEQEQAHDDIRNLINSADIATIFLDRHSRIKLFTPKACEVFNLIEADRGRPLSDINSSLVDVDLQAEVALVLEHLQRVEREVKTRDGRWHLMRVAPYRTADDQISGVAVTFVEITERKRNEDELLAVKESLAAELAAMTQLHNLGTRLLDTDGLHPLLEEILSAASTIQHADMGTVQLYDPHTGRLQIVAQRGFDHDVLARPDEQHAYQSASADALSRREPVVIEDTDVDPAYAPYRELARTAGYRAVQYTPLLSRTRAPLGLLAMHLRQPARPSERDIRLIDLYARQAAALIELVRGQEALQQSELRLRLVVDSIADYAIFTMDPEGRIATWNRGAARSFGFKESDVIGKSADMLYAPNERHAFAEGMQQARASGHAEDERWYLRHDGSRFFGSGILAPLYDHGNDLLGYVMISRDLTERKGFEDALREAHADLERRVDERTEALAASNRTLDLELGQRRLAEDQIRGLIRRLITVQEDERRLIARDLHDHLGQQVAALSLKLQAIEQLVLDDPPHRVVTEAQSIITAIDRDLDFFTWELRPAALDDLGLVVTLGNFVREWSANFGIAADFHTAGLDHVRLTYEIETNLYRIAQEALNNIFKHAGATRAGVILERKDGRVALIIEDDGRGFDRNDVSLASRDRGIGLLGMRERTALMGGSLEIETSPGHGTTLFVRVPVVLAQEAPGPKA